MRKKRPANRNIGVELNKDTISAFSASFEIETVQECALKYLVANIGKINSNGSQTFIYCDPPYPFNTRTSQHGYKHELTDNQHIELLRILKCLRCRVAISTYPSCMYEKELSEWRIVKYTSVKRSGRVADELLYCNYEEPKILHDDSYIGKSAGERQSIKRRLQRTTKRILGWSPGERVKLLKELIGELPESEKIEIRYR